jgi:hypothetical protein
MDTRAAAPRVLALAAVVAAHAGALLVLLAVTRSHFLRTASESPSILVMLLPPAAVRRPTAAEPERLSRIAPRIASTPPGSNSLPPPAQGVPPSSAIDWTAEAHGEVERGVERNEQQARKARALAPAPTAAFAPAPPRAPEFGWDYAATHRVLAIRGGVTLINLSDRCGLALWLVIPMGFGCALGKNPARGDLFEHLHDQSDPGEPTGH